MRTIFRQSADKENLLEAKGAQGAKPPYFVWAYQFFGSPTEHLTICDKQEFLQDYKKDIKFSVIFSVLNIVTLLFFSSRPGSFLLYFIFVASFCLIFLFEKRKIKHAKLVDKWRWPNSIVAKLTLLSKFFEGNGSLTITEHVRWCHETGLRVSGERCVFYPDGRHGTGDN